MDFRAITAGTVLTGIFWLIGQLAYVLIAYAIGVVSSTHEIPFFSTYKEHLWFVTAMILYCLTMIAGGYATAFLCIREWVKNATIMGGITGIIILLTTLGIGELSWRALLLVIFGFAFGALGGRVRERQVARSRPEENSSP